LDVLDAIGNTSLVRLRKIGPADGGEIFVKLEWENPTGSMKDRMALAAITRAEEDGRLRPGDTVVEYTGGSRGRRSHSSALRRATVSRSSPPMPSARRSATTWRRWAPSSSSFPARMA
jgi:threonine synthase